MHRRSNSPSRTVIDSSSSADEAQSAAAAGLQYVSAKDVGIHRAGRSPRFIYLYDDGTRVTDHRALDRIRQLAIPPAYVDVWICAQGNGHLQAAGRDARGRKQYRYHARWRAIRDLGKFDRMVSFGKALPRLRRKLSRDLATRGLSRPKVLALTLGVMADTLMRVGNNHYSRENKSYGLTTLRNRHVRPYRGRLHFHYRGKSGQIRDTHLDNARLIRLVRTIQQLPGQRLFQYVDDDGVLRPIDSSTVNEYLRDATGGLFTAKDFRTFGGTVQAVAVLARTPVPEAGDAAQQSALAAAVKEVAATLGNTPAVCRNSYIHPDVFVAWSNGTLHAAIPESAISHRRELERRTIALLVAQARANRSSRPRRASS